MKRISLAERFWSKVDKRGPRECWWWTAGRRGSTGRTLGTYGGFRVGNRMQLAHNVAWELTNKEKVPEGTQVNHHCDHPLCVNPYHLWLGTQAENIRQAVVTGRMGSTDGPLVPIRLFLPVKEAQVILAELRSMVTVTGKNRGTAKRS